MMRLLGHILLWAGFLVGSLMTVFLSTKEGVEYTQSLHPDIVRLEKEIATNEEILAQPDLAESSPEKYEKAKAALASSQKDFDSLKNVQTVVAAKGVKLQDLSKVTVPENGWHLIPWLWYGLSAAVCFAGVVLLHSSRRTATQKTDKSAASLNEITEALDRAIGQVAKLAKVSSTSAPSKIVAGIDDEIADDLRVFADGRDSMTTEHGLTVFADVMTPFAAGERAINRAWSAAADGYIDEATDCLNRGHEMLLSAREELAKAR